MNVYSGSYLNLIQLDDGLIELCFDARQGSVNVLKRDAVAELDQVLNLLETIESIRGMLITSSKSVFIAGADITEFGDVFRGTPEKIKEFFGRNNDNLNRLEKLPYPTVVAINGYALGGGCEFCLACDYRIMSTAAKIGLPEVSLGIIPGWGGTVRAPRLVGLKNALNLIVNSRHHNSDQAFEMGLVDEVATPEDLRNRSIEILKEAANESGYLERRKIKTHALSIDANEVIEVSDSAKEAYCSKTPQLLAPAKGIELISETVSLDGDEALRKEADLFAEVSRSAQCRALVGNFINDQFLKKTTKNYAKGSNLKITKASVVGAGIMGGGIAYQNALKGIPVVLKDIQSEALDLGMKEAEQLLAKKVARGQMTQDQIASTLENIAPTLDAAEMQDSDVIVEAVVENPEIKKMVLAELENSLAKGGLLVSNTSTISISSLSETLKHPENFAGLHFFNPVHAMPLVEVIRGEKTSEETITNLVDYCLSIGKQPIVVNDCTAFLVNRVLFPYYRGFELLVKDGIDFHQIDSVMQNWGWPMGPAFLADVIGIDTVCHCQQVLAGDFPERMSILDNSILEKLNSDNRLGQKNGKGFYQYEKDEKGRLQRSNDQIADELARASASAKTDLSEEEIEMRCMLPMAIEMARCLEEGIVGSPAEADMAMLMGLGFPSFRGGVLRWMDEITLAGLCKWSDRLMYLGEAYTATDHMREMAKSGQSYY